MMGKYIARDAPDTAPIPASSGNTQRHRLHRGGDRQLNRALHIIALSRARTDPTTRVYLDRRHAEGKTKKEAIRCLKRHLARRIWRLLYTTATASLPAAATDSTTRPADPNQYTIPPRPATRRPVDHTIPAAAPIICIT